MFWWEIFFTTLSWIGGIIGVLLVMLFSVTIVFLFAEKFTGFSTLLFVCTILFVTAFVHDAPSAQWAQIAILLFAVTSVFAGVGAGIMIAVVGREKTPFPLAEFFIGSILWGGSSGESASSKETEVYDSQGNYRGTIKED